jgi:hypothetical protein
MHILFISGLAGLFVHDRIYPLWFLLLLGIAYYFYRQAIKERSFYTILIVTLYTYIALSYMVVQLLLRALNDNMGAIYLGLLYFILSAIALVRILMILNKKMKAHDSV